SLGGIIVVDTTSDVSAPGTCTLRDAINTAQGNLVLGSSCNSAPTSHYEIIFANGVTGNIILGSSLPPIVGDLNITGPTTAPGITIDGNHAVQALTVQPNASLELHYLTIANGFTNAGGGAGAGLRNNGGNVIITNSTLSGNSATFGGAIFNGGILTLTNDT